MENMDNVFDSDAELYVDNDDDLVFEEVPIEKAQAEYREALAEAEFVRRDNDISDEEFAAHEEAIKERVSKMSDFKYNKIISDIIKRSNIPEDKQILFKMHLMKKLKTQDAIIEDYEEFQKCANEELKEEQNKVESMLVNLDYDEILNEVEDHLSKARETENWVEIKKLENFKKEIHSIFTLENMKEKANNIKPINVAKNVKFTEEEYNKEKKRFFNLLKDSYTYKFTNPTSLPDVLIDSLDKEFNQEDFRENYNAYNYGTIFFFNLYYYINRGKSCGLENNAVFLEGIFKNIKSFKNEKIILSTENKKEFLNSIKEYVEIFIDKLDSLNEKVS